MRTILLVGALATSFACATAGTTATDGTTATAVRHDPNLISGEELATSNGANAYEVISRLRPSFLRSRGTTTVMTTGSDYAAVYLDSQKYGDLSSLRSIPTSQIKEIRYYSGSEAIGRFGSMLGGGVIQVISK